MTWALLASGLLGSLHCVGMCGGFVLALGAPMRPAARWRAAARQAAFHAGKASTYVLLGVLAGLAGGALVRAPGFHAAQAVLAVVAGGLLVVAGLQIAGWLRTWAPGTLFGPGSLYDRAVRGVRNARGASGAFTMGALVGLLPCPLVYGFLAWALASGGVLAAAGTMALLGLASMPALALVALVGARVGLPARRRAVVVAGVLVAALGAVTVARGLAPGALHPLFGGAPGA